MNSLYLRQYGHGVKGKRILIPASNIARNDLERGLRACGAEVQRIEVYKNIPYKNPQREMLYEKIRDSKVDCITFFSPSAINTFADLMGEKGITLINTKKIPIAITEQPKLCKAADSIQVFFEKIKKIKETKTMKLKTYDKTSI